MPAMLISKEEWKEIQKASEAGVPDSQLSEQFGISKASIKMRRMREGWLTPARLKAEVAAQSARKLALSQGVSLREKEESKTGVVTRVTAEESIASKLLKMGETGTLALAEVALRKALFVRDNPETIDDLETIGDMSTALKLLRTAAGLDRQENSVAVALNFGAFWQSPSSAEVERPRVVDV